MKERLIAALATSVDAYHRCQKDLDEGLVHESMIPLREEWLGRHQERGEWLCKNYMPSGGGFDAGTTLDLDESTGEKLVFNASYHRMTEHGMYDGWVDFTVTATPSLIHGFLVEVTTEDEDEDDLADFVADSFREALRREWPREELYPKDWSKEPAA